MEEGGSTSIFNTHVPLLNAVLVGIWLIGTTITLTVQWMSVGTKIENLGKDLDRRMAVIEQQNTHRWTIEMQELWCARTEQRNPNWKCGDVPKPFISPIYPKAGSEEFWKPEKSALK